MTNNTKLLSFFSILIIIAGFSFLWFGLKPEPSIQSGPIPQNSVPAPSPIVQQVPESTASAALGFEGEKAYVTKVVDGDTIQIEGGATIRFIGIDTPETVDPRRPVGCFGKEASNAVKSLLSGKIIYLQKDVSEMDKYKRLLRYIYLPLENGQELFVQDYLVREGYAKVLTYPPDVKYNEQLRQAEKEAREKKRGLWGKC